MQLLSKDEFAALIVKLNSLVTEVAGEDGSAMEGLTMLSCAFGALLDSYAKPNGENPRGMCDDPAVFRKHFADLIAGVPQ
jgi:hypothetical protein